MLLVVSVWDEHLLLWHFMTKLLPYGKAFSVDVLVFSASTVTLIVPTLHMSRYSWNYSRSRSKRYIRNDSNWEPGGGKSSIYKLMFSLPVSKPFIKILLNGDRAAKRPVNCYFRKTMDPLRNIVKLTVGLSAGPFVDVVVKMMVWVVKVKNSFMIIEK